MQMCKATRIAWIIYHNIYSHCLRTHFSVVILCHIPNGIAHFTYCSDKVGRSLANDESAIPDDRIANCCPIPNNDNNNMMKMTSLDYQAFIMNYCISGKQSLIEPKPGCINCVQWHSDNSWNGKLLRSK